MPTFKKLTLPGGREIFVNMENVCWAWVPTNPTGTVRLEFAAGDGGVDVSGTIEEVLFDRTPPIVSKDPEVVKPDRKSKVLVVGLFFNSDGIRGVQSVSEVFAGPHYSDAGTHGFHRRILREIRSACRNTPHHVLVFATDPTTLRRKLVTEFPVDLITETPIE